jgi:hypothetical protein
MFELSPLVTAITAHAGTLQHATIEADAVDGAAREIGAETTERLAPSIDHHDVVPGGRHLEGNGGTDSATPHHDHMHIDTPRSRR